MIKFDVRIEIHRPVQDVFEFIAEGRNAPRWNSAVREVRQLSKGAVGMGTQFWMERKLPRGIVENTYEITEYVPGERLSVKSTSGPTPFFYRYSFEPTSGGTWLSLTGEGEVEGFLSALGPLLSRAVKKGVEDNFHTLKRILEGSL